MTETPADPWPLLDAHPIHAGERVALLGPNGAGKSTALRALAGLASDRPSPLSRRVAYVPQDFGASLLPWRTARANVALCGAPDACVWAAVPLGEHALGRRPDALSGGERQLVAIARALATPADALLLDEPFSALAASTRAAVRDALRAWIEARRATLVLVTHDVDDALALADRALVLREARCVADVALRGDDHARRDALRPWTER